MNNNITRANMPAQVKVKQVMLTPIEAKTMLLKNTHNRKISQASVNVMAEAMKRGEWTFNGQAIIVGADGTILDGQHRLLACVQSGVTIPTLVIRGVENDAQDTMDTGRSRRLSDVLSLKGEKNAVHLAALLSGLVRWDKYKPETAFKSTGGYPCTNGEALSYLDRYPDLRDVPTRVQMPSRNAYISSKILGILYWKFRDVNIAYAEDFIDKLSTGVGLTEDNPILLLRNRCKTLRDNSTAHSATNSVYVAALTIKAWNLYVTGNTVRQLKWTPGGSVNEVFPKILRPLDDEYDIASEVA